MRQLLGLLALVSLAAAAAPTVLTGPPAGVVQVQYGSPPVTWTTASIQVPFASTGGSGKVVAVGYDEYLEEVLVGRVRPAPAHVGRLGLFYLGVVDEGRGEGMSYVSGQWKLGTAPNLSVMPNPIFLSPEMRVMLSPRPQGYATFCPALLAQGGVGPFHILAGYGYLAQEDLLPIDEGDHDGRLASIVNISRAGTPADRCHGQTIAEQRAILKQAEAMLEQAEKTEQALRASGRPLPPGMPTAAELRAKARLANAELSESTAVTECQADATAELTGVTRESRIRMMIYQRMDNDRLIWPLATIDCRQTSAP